MRVLFVLVCFLFAAVPAAAQEMPSWAAPQELPEAREPSPESEASTRNSGAFECPLINPNPNCEDIVPAPVSEGLVLLALLGTGYAARRLRCVSDDE